jgi:hypothetical protein
MRRRTANIGKTGNGWAVGANLLLGGAGLALLVAALMMGRPWADHHFLPAWGYDWTVQLRSLLALRLALAALAFAVILLVRPKMVSAVAAGHGLRALGTALIYALAIAAAFAATETILRTRSWHSVQERFDLREPLRIRDRELGWSFAPNHSGTAVVNAREIRYATGPRGYRVPRAGMATDFTRPTILLAGESIVFGYGLDWSETIGAQLQALTGVDTATIAINAQGTDQALLRLRRELPRFKRPVAIVMPFMSRLFDRNLDLDRPHLDSGLRWHQGSRPQLRLVELARRVFRYRSRQSIAEGLALTRAALKATIRLAEARGARPVILVPQFLPEADQERLIRHELLDQANIPYLLVAIEPGWRNPGDGHPNPQGARVLAAAIADALRANAQPQCAGRPAPSRNCPDRHRKPHESTPRVPHILPNAPAS